jgi:hypothetical protein
VGSFGESPSINRPGAQRRRAASAMAKEKYRNVYSRVSRLQGKAKEAFEPRYTSHQLCEDLIKLATRWLKKGKLDAHLKQIRRLFELAPRERANKYLPLVRAVCPKELDRRAISKFAKKVERGVSRQTKK